MRIPIIAAALAGVCVLPGHVLAHAAFTSPTPRSPSSGLKTGPCGNVLPTGNPTVLTAGSTVTMTWIETVEHPGYYRVAFSQAGDQGYEENVLLDNIPDDTCTSTPCTYEAQVTLPSEPCEGCSLQLIQYMGVAPPYSQYFSCADITLVAGPVNDAGPDIPPVDPPDEGCTVAQSGQGMVPMLLAWCALMLLGRARRRAS